MNILLNNNTLTERELEVLNLLIEGYDNDAIAKMLCITVYTVKYHISNIYTKLSVRNKVQAAVYAVTHNLIDISR